MKNLFRKNIAMFMIVLVLTIPIYISSVFAETEEFAGTTEVVVPNPVQTCIDKSDKTDGIIEILDNDIITTLETIATTLHFTCSTWNTVRAFKHKLQIPVPGFLSDQSCVSKDKVTLARCAGKDIEIGMMKRVEKFMSPICSLTECALCNDGISEGGLDLSPTKLFGDFDTGSDGKIDPKDGNKRVWANDMLKNNHISPYDNIYVATACLCPAAILVNLKKLNTIYKTYDCCIEEACENGIDTQACERQLSEATCMYWEGSIATMLINVILSFVSKFISKAITEKLFKLQGGFSNLIKAGRSLYDAFTQIQGLISTFQQMQTGFGEPNCNDLGFDKIKDQRREEFSTVTCNLYNIDADGDGVYDYIDTRCT